MGPQIPGGAPCLGGKGVESSSFDHRSSRVASEDVVVGIRYSANSLVILLELCPSVGTLVQYICYLDTPQMRVNEHMLKVVEIELHDGWLL